MEGVGVWSLTVVGSANVLEDNIAFAVFLFLAAFSMAVATLFFMGFAIANWKDDSSA